MVRSANYFWRLIPSAKLYLVAAEIVNLNLNYEASTVNLDALRKELEKLKVGRISVTLR